MSGRLPTALRQLTTVCCGAGVPPAVFPAPHRAKTPAGRRRHENLASLPESHTLRFVCRIRREKCGMSSLLLCVFALLSVLGTNGCGKRGGETIVVGSKNFTEQIVLAEMFAQQIEAHSALRVERRLNLGGTLICHDALVSGKIDLYPEYTGTALTAILNDPPQKDPAEVFRRVQEEYRVRFNAEVMPALGFNNTFAMVVRGDDADKLHLRRISDVAPYAPKWRARWKNLRGRNAPDELRGRWRASRSSRCRARVSQHQGIIRTAAVGRLPERDARSIVGAPSRTVPSCAISPQSEPADGCANLANSLILSYFYFLPM